MGNYEHSFPGGQTIPVGLGAHGQKEAPELDGQSNLTHCIIALVVGKEPEDPDHSSCGHMEVIEGPLSTQLYVSEWRATIQE